MTDEIDGTSRLFHLNCHYWLFFFVIMPSIRDISMVVRKRKAEREFLEKEKEESVCSNSNNLEMSGLGNREEDFPLSNKELDLFKAIFLEFSTANRWSDENAYLECRWLEILDLYNERAVPMNFPEQTSIDMVIRAGTHLHSTFCKERANYEIRSVFLAGVGRYNPRNLPSRDDDLLRIFEPCLLCKSRVLIFPTSLLKKEKLENLPVEPLKGIEIMLFTDLCVQVSKGSFLAGLNLWDTPTWIAFANTYSEHAEANGMPKRTWNEMIKAGGELQSEFCKQRKDQKLGLIEEVQVDLQQIFGFCDSCNKRIPVFPYIHNSHSSLPSGSRGRSRVSGSRDRSHVSGSRACDFVNEGSRSVRQCSGSTHSDGDRVSTAETMSKAVKVLDKMYRRKHIEFPDLYRVIGFSTTEIGFLRYLGGPISFKDKVKRIPSMLLAVPNHVICNDPTVSDLDEALYTIEEMAKKKLIADQTYFPLVTLAGKDTVLVKYLISSISLRRKSEMMATFINHNS